MSDSPSTHKEAFLVVCQFLGLVNILFSKELSVVKCLYQLKGLGKPQRLVSILYKAKIVQNQSVKDIAQTKHLERTIFVI